MITIKPFIIATAFLGLAGCGGQQGGLLGRAVGYVMGPDFETPSRQAASVSEEELLGNPGKYLRINIREASAWDTLVVAGTNGSRTTWLGGSGISVTLEGGIVIATRGLPRDLMGADASQTVRAIQNGGGTARRVHDFLSDQDQVLQYVLDCTITRDGADPVNRLEQTIAATKFQEVCTSDGLGLTNVYWVNNAGKIVRSLQAVSPDAGYLQIDAF